MVLCYYFDVEFGLADAAYPAELLVACLVEFGVGVLLVHAVFATLLRTESTQILLDFARQILFTTEARPVSEWHDLDLLAFAEVFGDFGTLRLAQVENGIILRELEGIALHEYLLLLLQEFAPLVFDLRAISSRQPLKKHLVKL